MLSTGNRKHLPLCMIHVTGEQLPLVSQKGKSSLSHHPVTFVPSAEHKRTEILHACYHHQLAIVTGET